MWGVFGEKWGVLYGGYILLILPRRGGGPSPVSSRARDTACESRTHTMHACGRDSCMLSGQDNACYCTSMTCAGDVRLAFVSGACIRAITSAGAIVLRPLVATWLVLSLFHDGKRRSSRSIATFGDFATPSRAAWTSSRSNSAPALPHSSAKVVSRLIHRESVSWSIFAYLAAECRDMPSRKQSRISASVSLLLFVGRPVFAMSATFNASFRLGKRVARKKTPYHT